MYKDSDELWFVCLDIGIPVLIVPWSSQCKCASGKGAVISVFLMFMRMFIIED